jgi:AcrR family transcriptional regulator
MKMPRSIRKNSSAGPDVPSVAVGLAGRVNGYSNKHQQKTVETRRRLLLSARKVFARDGFEAARLEDISQEAGHTRGAFYAHFSNKEDLFFALLEQQAYEHQLTMQRLLSPLQEPEDKLRALREYYGAKAGDRRWSLLMLEFKLYAVRHPKIREKLAKTHRAIRQALRHEIEGLLPSDMRPSFQQESLLPVVLEALLQGLILEHAYDPDALKQEEVEGLLQRVFNLLTNRPEEALPGDPSGSLSSGGAVSPPEAPVCHS